jgi:hypothetical protein
MILESTVERFLVDEVRRRGGIAEKVRVIGARGFFDRFVTLPGGVIILVELKRPKGGRLSPHQRKRLEVYRRLGVNVQICKSREDVRRLMDAYDQRA